jgi:hypothetical protein
MRTGALSSARRGREADGGAAHVILYIESAADRDAAIAKQLEHLLNASYRRLV